MTAHRSEANADRRMPFDKNVFVNCPFDSDYLSLLRPLLFTVIDLGFAPRIALESPDSGRPRFDRIIALVQQSKFAIHDLSRLQASKEGELFRLNMPFELGIDIGCRLFKKGQWAGKRCLILEAEKYRYQAAISDLSNSDIEAHENKPDLISAKVRNWLNGQAQLRAPGPGKLWTRFNDFMADTTYDLTTSRGFSPADAANLPIDELLAEMKVWVARDPLA
jgi:hypothetical protein